MVVERVKLFPGVTVPRSIALAVQHGTIEDRIGYDADAGAESSNGSGSIDSEVAATIEDVERFLERERVRNRRHNEFGPRNYHWRRDMAPDGYKEPSRRPINPLGTELIKAYEAEVPATNGHWGVNSILEYLGFQGEPEKTAYLRGFNMDPNDMNTYRGVDAVRAGWHIASFYGVTGNKDMVKAAIQSIGTNGMRLTDAAIQRFGIESLPDIAEKYSSLRVNGLLSLVPTEDLGRIISAMRDPILGDLRGPAFMHELGFEVYRLGRTPILYSKPAQK